MGGFLGRIGDPIGSLKQAAGAVASGAGAAFDAGEDAAGALAGHAAGLVPDLVTLRAELPPYPVLPAAARARALARAPGLTAPQPVIRDRDSKPHEPVSLYVAGTYADLRKALESRGWKRAHEMSIKSALKTAGSIIDKLAGKLFRYNYQESPVSEQFLAGSRHELAFNKNNVHDMARDHLRIWDTGRQDGAGRPIWAIAATRDTALDIRPKKLGGGHQTDHAIDGERDLVMFDLLASGRVADWRIARGEATAAEQRHIDQRYETDGNVHLVDLAGAATGEHWEALAALQPDEVLLPTS